jgi:predicted DNA-binding protein
MITLKLPKDREDRLQKLAAATQRPKTFYIREALKRYLEEYEETFLTLVSICSKKIKFRKSDKYICNHTAKVGK